MKYRLTAIMLLLIVSIAFTMQSCKDEDPQTLVVNLDLEYFPIEMGYSWTYQVDSTFYDGFTQTSREFAFKVRNTVFDTTNDLSGRRSYILLRERDTGSGWMADRQFTVVKTTRQVEVIDQDIRTMKLVFPVRDYQRWDGNFMSTEPQEKFKYQNIDEVKIILDTINAKTALVLEKEYFNVIETFSRTSTYAREIGLIKYNDINIERKNSSGQFVQGSVVLYTLLEYTQ